ncbi:hypothetical protein KW830_08295 [Comamonas sp. CMM03]|uniref:hypothetical protein n=1 Tax=Comamonas sp. CMM03 TaxID=2854781 RepID=UPI001C477FAB|nr:hypothetical protein [Comamonas sp. CMM03]MBV7418455.1 hypothetical protein [Comamonas sp. CMM03]
MQLNTNIIGVDRVRKQLEALSDFQICEASAKALNDAAFQLRRDMQAHMRSTFDRVTPWIERSPKVIMATADKLEVSILPTYRSDAGTTGGKVGVDPQQVLQAQEYGGRRADKRSEVRLRRAGILPTGYQTAIPSSPFPGSDDGRGNIRGPFLTQLLSYLQTFGDAGYRANMGKAALKRMHERGGKANSFVGPVRGRRYIVTYGGMRGGARQTQKGEFDQRMANLAAGIWAVQGTGGVDVRPVLMFVRQGNYRPLLRLQGLRNEAERAEYLGRRLRFHIRSSYEFIGPRMPE